MVLGGCVFLLVRYPCRVCFAMRPFASKAHNFVKPPCKSELKDFRSTPRHCPESCVELRIDSDPHENWKHDLFRSGNKSSRRSFFALVLALSLLECIQSLSSLIPSLPQALLTPPPPPERSRYYWGERTCCLEERHTVSVPITQFPSLHYH